METSLIITDEDCTLCGILRGPQDATRMVVLIPAITGTRIGPQRIYVEIARQLSTLGVATFCCDLPPFGDSVDLKGVGFGGDLEKRFSDRYAFYLEKIDRYFGDGERKHKMYWLTISVGCQPIVNYAKSKGHPAVILLSPHLLVNAQSGGINKDNVKSYRTKMFRRETWIKLFSGRLKFRSIFRNVINLPSSSGTQSDDMISQMAQPLDILCIYGERDSSFKKCQLYWQQYVNVPHNTTLSEFVVPGADHSFFGWLFKAQVTEVIMSWMKTNKCADATRANVLL